MTGLGKKEKEGEGEAEILKEWGVKLAEEIEQYTKMGVAPIKNGSLEDALDEAQVVLDMLEERDLAERAQKLATRLAEVRLMIRSTRSITASAERAKMEAQKLARDMRKRLQGRLEVGARKTL